MYRFSPHKKSEKDQTISMSCFSFFLLEASGAEGGPSLPFFPQDAIANGMTDGSLLVFRDAVEESTFFYK
jgi:hypothetical protein